MCAPMFVSYVNAHTGAGLIRVLTTEKTAAQGSENAFRIK